MKQITIQSIDKPDGNGVNDALQWLCESLGMFTERDKDRSCFRIFIELLKSTKKDRPMSSDELAAKLGLARGTVIYHLNKLMESGIVVCSKNRYMLRDSSLQKLLGDVKKDICEKLDNIGKVAAMIDGSL